MHETDWSKVRADPSVSLDWQVIDVDRKLVLGRGSGAEGKAYKSASVPKIMLLHEVSRMIEDGELSESQVIDRRGVTVRAGDAGLWQHMKSDSLPLADVALLVATFSDNWATNALIDLVGLNRLEASSRSLLMPDTRLHDYVRPERIAGLHPPTVSTARARDLVLFCAEQEEGWRRGHPVFRRVVEWARRGVDHSMVLSPMNLDALSGHISDEGLTAWNKTGTDTGVRADCGIVRGPSSTVAYAAIANWTPTESCGNGEVLRSLREIGRVIQKYCASA